MATKGGQELEGGEATVGYADGIPSHDTLNDVINAIDGDLFAQCFSDWVASLQQTEPELATPEDPAPEIVAIDGKT